MSFMEQITQTLEGRKLYNQEKLILDITEIIYATMRKKHLSQSQLAKLARLSKTRITQILNGTNFTIRTISDICTVLGIKMEVSAKKL